MAGQPITRNVLKDQLHEQRRGLIKKVKDLRIKRNELMGVPNTSKQWANLTAEINAISEKIDSINVMLDIPVMVYDKESGKMVEKKTKLKTSEGGLKRGELHVLAATTDASKSVF